MTLYIQSNADDAFQDWYCAWSMKLGLHSDPDHPEHEYDWRAAWMAGAEPDEHDHWPSEFKRPGHPNIYVEDEIGLLDTKTNTRWFSAAKLEKAETDAKRWKSDFEMYANAWRRSLGHRLLNKGHLIDALVATTELLQQNYDTWDRETRAIKEQREIEAMAATFGIDHRSYLNG
jgi:hypothetical protein